MCEQTVALLTMAPPRNVGAPSRPLRRCPSKQRPPQQHLQQYVKPQIKKLQFKVKSPVKKAPARSVEKLHRKLKQHHRGARWGINWLEGAVPDGHVSEEVAAMLARRKATRKKRIPKAIQKLNAKAIAAGIERRTRDQRKSEAEADAESEALARTKVQSCDFSLASVLQVLRCVVVPENTTRKNVMPEGAHSIRGLLLGLYVYGGSVGVAAHTTKRPWLTRLLVGALRSAAPDFPFTSIQLNYNYASRPHVDKGNLGNSYIVGLGDYSGGELWVHDDTGPEQYVVEGQEDVSAFYRVGSAFRGRQLQVHNIWTTFDGNKLHFTLPFQGERYSIIFFTCDRYADAAAPVREALHGAGFDFNWSAKRLEDSQAAKCEERSKVASSVAKARSEEEAQLLLLRGRCIGRIWADGWGLRCTAVCEEGKDLCGSHITRSTWKTHGRFDGPVPPAKEEEMRRTQRRHVGRGKLPPVIAGATILVDLPTEGGPYCPAD